MDEIYLPGVYVRHQGPTTTQRVFPGPPRPTDEQPHSPTCLVCDEPIIEDQPCVIIPIGCESVEDQDKMMANGWVSARGILVHARCGGRNPNEAGSDGQS